MKLFRVEYNMLGLIVYAENKENATKIANDKIFPWNREGPTNVNEIQEIDN